jgi:hypothetical protein
VILLGLSEEPAGRIGRTGARGGSGLPERGPLFVAFPSEYGNWCGAAAFALGGLPTQTWAWSRRSRRIWMYTGYFISGW